MVAAVPQMHSSLRRVHDDIMTPNCVMASCVPWVRSNLSTLLTSTHLRRPTGVAKMLHGVRGSHLLPVLDAVQVT